jgi:DivIVA domain-containing protein
MTNSDHHPVSLGYQTAKSIRDASFQRRLRGCDVDEVYEYLDLLADQVQATERELDDTRAENGRLRAEVRRVQAELDDYEQVGDRVNEQVVQLFSQAQLVAEEMVEEVSRDARERVGQAREHEREIVQGAMATAGQQVRSYARSAQAQMQSIVESFATEVDQLGISSAPGDSAAATPLPNASIFDDLSNRQVRSRNGSHRDSSGSD